MLLNNVKKVSFFIYIFSAFSLAGTCALYSFYGLLNFGVIPDVIINVINWCFNIIFNSLDFLGFFIRPRTIKLVVQLFTFYYLMKFTFRATIVTIKIGRFLFDYVGTLRGMLVRWYYEIIWYLTLTCNF